MDAKDIKDEEKEEKPGGFKPGGGKNPRAWRVLAGLFVVFAGSALLFQKMGYFYAPWLFTWPVFLILLGVFTGIKSGFRHFASFILIAIGSIFLAQEVYTDIHVERFIWPVVMIVVGLGFIFGRGRGHCGPWGGHHGHRRRRMQDRMKDRFGDDWQRKWEEMRRNKAEWHAWKHEWRHEWQRSRYAPGTSTDAGEILDINAVFGSVKRTVLSKNFAGPGRLRGRPRQSRLFRQGYPGGQLRLWRHPHHRPTDLDGHF
jgi:hypothetical protein